MNQLTNLNTGKLTKHKIAGTGQALAAPILDGEIDAIDGFTRLHAFRAAVDEAIALVKPIIVDDIDRHGERGRRADSFGATVEVTAGRTTYDYSHDSEWSRLVRQRNELNEQIKAREKLLVALATAGQPVADTETGEYLEGARVAKVGDPIVRVTYQKE